jgi:hypothetical protein
MSCIGRIEKYFKNYGLGIILYKKQKVLFIPNSNQESKIDFTKNILPIGTIVEFELKKISTNESLEFFKFKNLPNSLIEELKDLDIDLSNDINLAQNIKRHDFHSEKVREKIKKHDTKFNNECSITNPCIHCGATIGSYYGYCEQTKVYRLCKKCHRAQIEDDLTKYDNFVSKAKKILLYIFIVTTIIAITLFLSNI